MAIYHYHCGIIGRKQGYSALAAAGYRSGSDLWDEETNKRYVYTRRQDVLHKEIVGPENMPKWMCNQWRLWNAVEKVEKRIDAQLAREVQLSLPHELSLEQNRELLRNFVQEIFCAKGMVADFAIHAPPTEGDQRNIHAHIMLTMRNIDENGLFIKKNKDWNHKDFLKYQREAWSDHVNRALQKAGYTKKVDHRSYKERGIKLTPTARMGRDATALERQDIPTKVGNYNRKVVEKNREAILEVVTANRSYFNARDLARDLRFQFGLGYNAATKEANTLIAKMQISGDIISLHNSDGTPSGNFTTPQIRKQEKRIIRLAEEMRQAVWGWIKNSIYELTTASACSRWANKYEFNEQQRAAFVHAAGPDQISMIEGRAGTGKSYVMHALRELAGHRKKRVIGLAPTHKVVDDMREGGFSDSRTLHSFLAQAEWAKANKKPMRGGDIDKNTVIMLDEAAMVGTRNYDRLLKLVKRTGAKVVLFGDGDRQLQSVERGGIYNDLRQVYGQKTLDAVIRQKTAWGRRISESLADGNYEDAVHVMAEKDCLKWCSTRKSAVNGLVDQYMRDHKKDPSANRFIFGYTNASVDALNDEVQNRMIESGKVKNVTEVVTTREDAKGYINTKTGKVMKAKKTRTIVMGVGDRIQFRETNKDMGVKNGMFGHVRCMYKSGRIVVELDEGRTVVFNNDEYQGFALGYAGTAYRGQGASIDDTYVLHTPEFGHRTSYVALSRFKHNMKVYMSKEDVKDRAQLIRQIRKAEGAGSSLQFQTEKDLQKGSNDGPEQG